MKKKILCTLLFTIISAAVSASPVFYLKTGYLWSYDTNIFSNPLIKYASDDWFEWRAENPYHRRFNNGFHLEFNAFFSEYSRTGISTSIDSGFAYKALNIIPQRNAENKWVYEEQRIEKSLNPFTFFGIGPTFRSIHGIVDLGLALRFSLGAYDYSCREIIIGIQAEPYLNIFATETFFISIGGHYDAHIMNFYLNDPNKYFKENYVMVNVGGYIGVGFILGSRG